MDSPLGRHRFLLLEREQSSDHTLSKNTSKPTVMTRGSLERKTVMHNKSLLVLFSKPYIQHVTTICLPQSFANTDFTFTFITGQNKFKCGCSTTSAYWSRQKSRFELCDLEFRSAQATYTGYLRSPTTCVTANTR